MLIFLHPIGSLLGTVIIISATIAFLVYLIKGAFNLIVSHYRRYKYIKSDEFKAYLDSIPYEAKLNDLYEKVSLVICVLAIFLAGVLYFNAPTYLVLLVALPLVGLLHYNYKIAKKLKKI